MKPLPQLDLDNFYNAHLQRLVQSLHVDDAALFIAKFAGQTLRERFHSYRELLMGVQLRQGGANFRYEQNIYGQTPDWSLTESGRLIEFVDVMTLHQRNEKEHEITTSIQTDSRWDGWITVPPDHIYRKLSDKAGQYSSLALKSQVPYVVAVFGEFLASISPEEFKRVLDTQHGGWFTKVPEVSAVIYFREVNFSYEFFYFPNANANRPAVWSSQISRWSYACPSLM